MAVRTLPEKLASPRPERSSWGRGPLGHLGQPCCPLGKVPTLKSGWWSGRDETMRRESVLPGTWPQAPGGLLSLSARVPALLDCLGNRGHGLQTEPSGSSAACGPQGRSGKTVLPLGWLACPLLSEALGSWRVSFSARSRNASTSPSLNLISLGLGSHVSEMVTTIVPPGKGCGED